MATIVIPLPSRDVDPTESGVPWRVLTGHGHRVVFATPDGQPAQADPRMLSGEGLGPFKAFLVADRHGREAHAAMVASAAFQAPECYDAVSADDIDALVLPGGHAPGMREYLEAPRLQSLVAAMFAADKPVAAICHGVLVAARAHRPDGRSVLHGRRSTALLQRQELLAWRVTRAWAGDYYRTYPTTVQAEVTAALASPDHFVAGPLPLRRDAPGRPGPGFVCRDGRYLSARWPGDAHRFSDALCTLLAQGG